MGIRLRELKRQDVAGMLEWINDPEIQGNFLRIKDRTLEEVTEFIDRAQIRPKDGKDVHFAIADSQDEYVGTASLKNFNLTARNAEYAISLRKKAQGRGVAYEATGELLHWAFHKINLERVYLNVLADNIRAIRLYEKCGFIYEGEFRNHLFMKGEYKTLKWYGMLKEDYRKVCKNWRGGGYS